MVFMGVSGCGKSSLGAAVARKEGLQLVEGDDFHSAANRIKMNQGIALNDDDREDWLTALSEQLRSSPNAIVLTCSSLKLKYRDRLRQAQPDLRFVFLSLTPEEARARVQARASHFFSESLVDSQFESLEPPEGEPNVLQVDATAPLHLLQSQVSMWLHLRGQSSIRCHPPPSPHL